MILRRGAQHRRAADVDLFDRLVDRHSFLRDRRLERIEIDDDEVDRRDAEALDVGDVRVVGAVVEDRAEHVRRQRLDAAAEDLGSAGPLRDRRDRDAGVGEMLRRAAGREDLDAFAR